MKDQQLIQTLKECRDALALALDNNAPPEDRAKLCVVQADNLLHDLDPDPGHGQAAERIRHNRYAPADTVIRAIFRHFDYIRDDEDGHVFKDAAEALDMWYGVDMLDLVFDRKDTEHEKGQCDYWVRLIHQGMYDRPTIEDISDYTASLEETPLGPVLKEEYYNTVYR